MDESIHRLKELLDGSDNIVFFGGAGVSTESGNIPDFRSVDGLYSQQFDYPPETILSHTFYVNGTRRSSYRLLPHQDALAPDAKPNTAHLEAGPAGRQEGKSEGGHHPEHRRPPPGGRAAGRCWSFTAACTRNYCTRCGKFYGVEHIAESDGRSPLCVRRRHQAGRGAVRGGAGRERDDKPAGPLHFRQADVLHHRRYVAGGVSGGGACHLLPGTQAGGHQQGRRRRRPGRCRHGGRPHRTGAGAIITRKYGKSHPGRGGFSALNGW